MDLVAMVGKIYNEDYDNCYTQSLKALWPCIFIDEDCSLCFFFNS